MGRGAGAPRFPSKPSGPRFKRALPHLLRVNTRCRCGEMTETKTTGESNHRASTPIRKPALFYRRVPTLIGGAGPSPATFPTRDSAWCHVTLHRTLKTPAQACNADDALSSLTSIAAGSENALDREQDGHRRTPAMRATVGAFTFKVEGP